MLYARTKKMAIEVKGVKADAEMGRDLMKEIVRRNCKVDPRIIGSMVDFMELHRVMDHEERDYQLWLENCDIVGVTKDFELLKKAGVVKQVIKLSSYIVY